MVIGRDSGDTIPNSPVIDRLIPSWMAGGYAGGFLYNSLTYMLDIGKYAPHIREYDQVTCQVMDTNTFLQTHRVFNLDEAVQALAPSGGRKTTLERLKYAD